jgi:mitochondrial fission process protein 1
MGESNSKGPNGPVEEVPDVARAKAGERPDFSTPPARKPLPKEIQETLDNEEKLWDTLYEGRYV